MLDLVENHIVGFLMTWLIFLSHLSHKHDMSLTRFTTWSTFWPRCICIHVFTCSIINNNNMCIIGEDLLSCAL